MSYPKAKASRAENELATILWSLGYAAVRGPSSGGGVKRRFQPDLVALKEGKILVFEVKMGREGEPVYLESSQVLGLTEFSRRSGGLAFIAVRLRGEGWRFHSLERLETTRGGNFKLERPESGLKIRDLEEALFPKTEKLSKFMV